MVTANASPQLAALHKPRTYMLDAQSSPGILGSVLAIQDLPGQLCSWGIGAASQLQEMPEESCAHAWRFRAQDLR